MSAPVLHNSAAFPRSAVLPGSTVGVLGSGQLGRMFTIAARRMGYRVFTLSPDQDSPTGQVADEEVVASYDDLDAIRAFARRVDVITFEFENVSSAATEAAAEVTPVREIDDRRIGNGRRGEITTAVQRTFFDIVRGSDGSFEHWLDWV